MGITFAVDDVAAVRERLETRPLDEMVREALGVAIHAVSHGADLVERGRSFHPLLQAVHVAFAEHRPLVLSPDHVWLTIAQGFATHLDLAGDSLRERFVRHDGKKALTVKVLEMPSKPEAWGAVVRAFRERIAEHVGPGTKRLLECRFSTTTAVEEVASGVVMMSAFKRYFDFAVMCICGIPEITLEGTPEDWIEIRRRVDVLGEYDLAWWTTSLAPILDELVRTAQGAPDRDFWQCIYKPEEVYGGEIVTGWIMQLFPYLTEGRNPTLVDAGATGRARWIRDGLAPSSAPMAWSNARVELICPDGTEGSVVLYAGFAGLRQLADGALRPEVTWAVGAVAAMTRVVETIRAAHAPGPKPAPLDDPYRELPAELLELYDAMDGATLFGCWVIPRRGELVTCFGSTERGFQGIDPRATPERGHDPSNELPVVPICLLAGDPRFLGLYYGMVILCDPRVAQDAERIPIVAMTVGDFFRLLLEHEGRPWFDEAPSLDLLYPHLPSYHSYLRRALQDAGPEVPTDLSRREQEQIVIMLCYGRARSPAHRDHLWAALRGSTGTSRTFEELFAPPHGRIPSHVFDDLGLE